MMEPSCPAGSQPSSWQQHSFPLKAAPDHKSWHFLRFLNDDINHLLFLSTLSETFGNSILFLIFRLLPRDSHPLFSLARCILCASKSPFHGSGLE